MPPHSISFDVSECVEVFWQRILRAQRFVSVDGRDVDCQCYVRVCRPPIRECHGVADWDWIVWGGLPAIYCGYALLKKDYKILDWLMIGFVAITAVMLIVCRWSKQASSFPSPGWARLPQPEKTIAGFTNTICAYD